jgi:hypothetical protein
VNRDLVARELLLAARDLIGFRPRLRKNRPQRPNKRLYDRKYYRKHRSEMRKQQKKYWKRNKRFVIRERKRQK